MINNNNINFENASLLGVSPIKDNEMSAFGIFWATFLGYLFIDANTKKPLTRTQVFWRDKKEAINI